MKHPVITMWQPWASLTMTRSKCVCNGDSPPDPACPGEVFVKRFETRGHRAPKTIIGKRVLIHAALRKADVTEIGIEPWRPLMEAGSDARLEKPLPLGAIIGSAIIGEPVPTTQALLDIEDQFPFGDWGPGRWAWPLLDPRPLVEPIQAKGAQGVWYWEGDIS